MRALHMAFTCGIALPANSAAEEVTGFWETQNRHALVSIAKCSDGTQCGILIGMPKPASPDRLTVRTPLSGSDRDHCRASRSCKICRWIRPAGTQAAFAILRTERLSVRRRNSNRKTSSGFTTKEQAHA